MSFYPINYQEPFCPLAQLISDPAVTFCSYLMSGGVRWDGNMAVSHWLPTGYLRRGARAGIREKEDSVLGKPRCNYTDPRKASHTYREGHIENYWKRRRGLSVHGNTPGFLLSLFIYFECIQREQNGVVIIHRHRRQMHAAISFLVKHHLPPAITVLNSHVWVETNVGYKPHIHPPPPEGTFETAHVRENQTWRCNHMFRQTQSERLGDGTACPTSPQLYSDWL